jgi:hypothetical protein
MLANVLIVIFVCGFFGTFAFGHVLLITAIWPQLIPGRRHSHTDPAAAPESSVLHSTWKSRRDSAARAIGIVLIAALAVASMPARQVAGSQPDDTDAGPISHPDSSMSPLPVFRIDNYGLMLTGP